MWTANFAKNVREVAAKEQTQPPKNYGKENPNFTPTDEEERRIQRAMYIMAGIHFDSCECTCKGCEELWDIKVEEPQ